MEDILYRGFQYLSRYNGWILWNLFLAFIPLCLSFILFRQSSILPGGRVTPSRLSPVKERGYRTQQGSVAWWIVLVVYGAFLPNAPYVLTDIIHLIQATWGTPSVWVITLFYIPLHLGAIALAFGAYVVSLINQSAFLRRAGLKQYIFSIELLTHSLCAVGIYLGRFLRFNSWDLVTGPHNVLLATLNDLTGKRPLAVILATVLILTVLYWLMKQVTLGLLLRFQELRNNRHTFD
jgi:uncharacterized membrane protein